MGEFLSSSGIKYKLARKKIAKFYQSAVTGYLKIEKKKKMCPLRFCLFKYTLYSFLILIKNNYAKIEKLNEHPNQLIFHYIQLQLL